MVFAILLSGVELFIEIRCEFLNQNKKIQRLVYFFWKTKTDFVRLFSCLWFHRLICPSKTTFPGLSWLNFEHF